LISYLKKFLETDVWMHLLFAWYLMLLTLLGILSRCPSLRNLEYCWIGDHVLLREKLSLDLWRHHPVNASRDEVSAAVQVAFVIVAGLGSTAGGGRLIQTTSGSRQHRIDRHHCRGFLWSACW
jgi:hypothetical protein